MELPDDALHFFEMHTFVKLCYGTAPMFLINHECKYEIELLQKMHNLFPVSPQQKAFVISRDQESDSFKGVSYQDYICIERYKLMCRVAKLRVKLKKLRAVTW